jgi:hypothetical protein
VCIVRLARIIAANAILDRGWGGPPQALQVCDGDVQPEEREESALEFIESRLAELGASQIPTKSNSPITM